jgi:transposase
VSWDSTGFPLSKIQYFEVLPMYSFFVGIDIGKYRHQAAFIDSQGNKSSTDVSFENTGEGFELLLLSLNRFDKEQTVVGLEATGHYWLALYSFLADAGWTIKVINPIQSDAFRNIYIRKTKTDRMDSFIIAEVLRFGRYTETVLPNEKLSQLKELSRCRVGLAETIGNLKRKTLAILDRVFPEFAGCFSNTFGSTPVELLNKYPSPEELANADTDKLIKLLEKSSRGRHSAKKATELKALARSSIGVKRGLSALTFELKLLMEQMSFVEKQVKELDSFIEEIMKDFRLILSIPGIGPVTGGAIIGEIGDVARFGTPQKLQAFAGMDPRVTQSGQFVGTDNKISKRGSPYLRRAVYIAANIAKIHDPIFKEHYDRLVARGKHPKQALAAVATKLLRVIHAVMVKQVPYTPAILSNQQR